MDPALRRLYVATFLYSFAQAEGVPLVPERLALDFGASLGFIGAVMGLYGLMQIFLRLPMGDMADRRGRKPSLVIAFATTVGSGLIFAFGPNAWWAIPGAILFGFAGGIYWVAANSYLFDRAEASGGAASIAQATSNYTIAMSLAFLVGPPVGHFVAERFGFTAAFLLYAVTSLAGMLISLSLPEVKPAARPRPATSSYRRALGLLKHPALRLSALGTLVYSMMFATQQAFFQLHVLAVGLGLTVAGLLLGGRQASSLLVRVGLPQMLKRVGPGNVLVGGLVVLVTSLALIPLATSLPALAALVLFGGAATGVLIPANLMLVHEGAPAGERGLANGIYGTMLGIGSAIAPVAFGWIGARGGLAWTFWSAAITGALLTIAIALYRSRNRQPDAAATG